LQDQFEDFEAWMKNENPALDDQVRCLKYQLRGFQLTKLDSPLPLETISYAMLKAKLSRRLCGEVILGARQTFPSGVRYFFPPARPPKSCHAGIMLAGQRYYSTRCTIEKLVECPMTFMNIFSEKC
jgi:hypothetical protein